MTDPIRVDRDLDATVRGWLRSGDGPAPERHRQIDRILVRVDETKQRRRAWPLNPFGRRAVHGAAGSDSDQGAPISGRTTTALVPARMATVFALVLVVAAGLVWYTAQPREIPVAPGSLIDVPADQELRARFAGVWSGGSTTLDEVVEVYAEDAVHTALWHDSVERFEGQFEIWQRIGESGAADPGEWIPLPDAGTGEHRYLSMTDDLDGTACVFWVKDALITRHDCILSQPDGGGAGLTFAPASLDTIDVWRGIQQDFIPGWATADLELVERTVSPGIVHHVAYDNHEKTLTGIGEYMTVMGYGEIAELTDPLPLPAPEGEHRWTDFSGIAGGTLCTFWERGGLIARHDCIVPTFTYIWPGEADGT